MKKLDLASQIEMANTVKKGPPCSFISVYNALDPEDAGALRSALDNPDVKLTTIYRVLNDNNFKVSKHTIARHRRRECLCEF